MLLTLLHSQVAPPLIETPGGGGPSASARRYGWLREWEIELATARKLAEIASKMAQSERPQARRIAKKIEDYTGDIRQAESLRRELAKLEIAQRQKIKHTAEQIERDSELQAVAYELNNILLEEEDAIQAILALEEFEASFVLSTLGIKIH